MIFHQNELPIKKNLDKAKRFEGSGNFFSQFAEAINDASFQVLKLETRQFYSQPGNEGYEALIKGDFEKSLSLLEKSVEGDKPLYSLLRKKGVDMIRCRPVQLPLTDYLKWEMRHYELNEKEGERIFCCDYATTESYFQNVATHDFMVFDDKTAFIHDYDREGLNIGGWVSDDPEVIKNLQTIFISIKSRCRPFRFFSHNNGTKN